ncbi:MAG: hypothetical protein PHG63_02415 [Candidatus Dojkabacteria bacterium]|nr:hypothetical protein [Candidatus Dojkabacteria bacterium]
MLGDEEFTIKTIALSKNFKAEDVPLEQEPEDHQYQWSRASDEN